MDRSVRNEWLILVLLMLLILLAYSIRFLFPDFPFNTYVRPFVLAGILIPWGISLYWRINHPQIRRFAVAIVALLLFWLFVRTVKYELPTEYTELTRYLWYFYYLSMLFVPMVILRLALALGLPENNNLPFSVNFLYVLPLVLFLMVLTNDFHYFVFTLPEAPFDFSDAHHGWGWGYGCIVAYLLLLALVTLYILNAKCRFSSTRPRYLLPALPILLLFLYILLFNLRIKWVQYYLADITIIFCVLYALMFEFCIVTGFIRTNTGYRALLEASSLYAEILDINNNVCLFSQNEDSILSERQYVFKNHAIKFGSVCWREDVTELMETIEQVKENQRELAERNLIFQKNLETRKKILSLQEKNRILDLLNKQTAEQISLIDHLLSRYESVSDPDKKRCYLAGAAIVGAYIKRYGNLLLMHESAKNADLRELGRCIDESFMNLKLLDVNCFCSFTENTIVKTSDLLRIYSTFEMILEKVLFDVKEIWIHARKKEYQIFLTLECVAHVNLSSFSSLADAYSVDDETTSFIFILKESEGATGC